MTGFGVLLPGALTDAVLGIVALTALSFTISAARKLRGSRGWRLLTLGAALIALSPALHELHIALISESAPVTLGDVQLFAGYVVFVAGLRFVLAARTMAFQVRASLDATLISLWSAVLIFGWAGPRLAESLQGLELLAAILFVPLEVVTVYVIVELILGSDTRSPSVWLLAATASLSVVSELAFLAAEASSTDWRPVGVAVATMALVCLAAAIGHPSAAELELPSAAEQAPLSMTRSFWVVASLFGVIVALQVWPRPPVYLQALLTAIVVATAITHQQTTAERERLIARERQLRHALARLWRTSAPSAMLELGSATVLELLSSKRTVSCDFLIHQGGTWKPTSGATAGESETIDPRSMQDNVDSAVASGATIRTEYRDGDGRGRYLTRLIIPILDVPNHVGALVVEASPVMTTTEIAQVEQVAVAVGQSVLTHEHRERSHEERADHRFRALVQDSGDIVVLVDPVKEQIIMVSPAIDRLLSLDEASVLGTNLTGFLHPEDVRTGEDLLSMTSDRSGPASVDVRLRHADGHYHWFSATARDQTTDDEVGGLVVNLTDIHDRKMAELSLTASEERYRSLVLGSKDVFVVIEPDMTVSYVSPNVHRVLGYDAADLISTKAANLLTESSRTKLDDFVTETPPPLRGELIELELRAQSGEIRTTQVTISERDGGGYNSTISDVTEQRNLEETLRSAALYDPLTGLANRNTLHHEIQGRLQRLRSGHCLGVVHLDINDFKAVNESVGFEAGDKLLVQVSTRLRSHLRTSDVLARVGGNEFAIAVIGSNRSELTALVGRIDRLFHDPFQLVDRPHRLSASIGLSSTEDRQTVAGDLMEEASLALGQARRTGVSPCVFEPEMRASATERFELATDLPAAIKLDQLTVVYQPIVEIGTRNVRGVEALLRWTHPTRGPVSPGVFIPLAEKSGFVVELGRWVLSEACRQLRSWDQTVNGGSALGMSVNVSAIQLDRPGETEELAKIVNASGIDPGRLTIELTESTLIQDAEWTRSQLQSLGALGMRVAVDDFGTGAAGLSHLRDVPFDVIKIDRSYVAAMTRSAEARRLVRGVIDLAHALGAETVAEGIEEQSEFDALRSLGCELGQGFYLGRPMEAHRLESWFASGWTGVAPALIARQASDR